MYRKAELDEAVKTALRDREHFHAALAIWLAFDLVKNRMFERFAGALSHRMLKELNRGKPDTTWGCDNLLLEDVFGQYKGLYFRRKDLMNGWSVALEPESTYARNFIFGIKRDAERSKVPMSESDLRSLDRRYGAGRSSDWWPWYRYVDVKYRDWENETLMEIYEVEDALRFYTSELSGRGLIDFAEQISNRIERPKPR